MKTFIIVVVMTAGILLEAKTASKVQVKTFNEENICKILNQRAEENCKIYMCEEYEAENKEKCEMDGDFYEGVSVCMDEAFSEVINQFNSTAYSKVKCDN